MWNELVFFDCVGNKNKIVQLNGFQVPVDNIINTDERVFVYPSLEREIGFFLSFQSRYSMAICCAQYGD